MLDFLNVLYRSLSPLWEMSVTAAYAAAVVIVLRLLLKKRAPRQVLCLLWLVVFARLLIPVSLESPLSIVPDGLPGQEHITEQAPAAPGDGDPVTPITPQNPVQDQTQNQPGNGTATPVTGNQTPSLSIPEGAGAPAPAPEAPAAFPWQAVVAGVWLTGAAAFGGYGLVSWLRLRRRLFDAIRAKDGAWEHPAVESPFILGILRPRIYLPAGLTGQPRQFILCHERAHLRRFDHIVKPVCWFALTLHWFNPLVWAAFLLMSRDIEAACDEAVVRQLGSGVKADYSETLLALATGRRLPAPCPLAFDEGDAGGRIRNVLSYRRPALWAIVISVIAAALAAVCLLTDPVAAREPEGDPDPDPDPDVASSQGVEGLNYLLDPWMKEFLDGEREFLLNGTENLTVDQLAEAFFGPDPEYQYERNVTVSKVAIIDLDRDGLNEMVLWPSLNGDDSIETVSVPGYLILRRQGDAVYGFNPPFRGFAYLKADGTFEWEDSAFEGGTATMSFDGDWYALKYVTWFNINADKELYFVEGREVTREEFLAACDAQDAKPEPVWYVYRDGVLYAESPAGAADFDVPVPDFLVGDQRKLYAQAMSLYSRLFGASSENVDPSGYGTTAWVEYNDRYYYPTDVYGSWDNFEQTVLSLFTRNFWAARNQDGLFVNLDGTVHYLDYARGSGSYNENFPETFRLVEQTENAVSFIMTGYYSDGQGVPNGELEPWLARGWEYSIEFPMRMVWTADGWRFDEFHNARTDNGVSPFYEQRIVNPDAPPRPGDVYGIYAAAPLDAPLVDPFNIPEDRDQWYKVAELPDDMIWMYSRDQGAETLLRWDQNLYMVFDRTAHTSYGIMPQLKKLSGDPNFFGPLAVISNVDKGTGFYWDELVVYDLDAAGPGMDYTHDWRPLMDDFNENVSWQYDRDTRTLTFTYQGQTVKAVIDANDEARLRIEHDYPELGQEDLRLSITGELVYYRFDEANEGGIIIEMPAALYVGDEVVPLIFPGRVSWTLRFNGGGFDTVPGSCRLTADA